MNQRSLEMETFWYLYLISLHFGKVMFNLSSGLIHSTKYKFKPKYLKSFSWQLWIFHVSDTTPNHNIMLDVSEPFATVF